MTVKYQKALEFIAQKKYLFALAILDLVLEEKTNFIDGYYQRGRVKEYLEDFAGAIADYQQIIKIKPTTKAYLCIALIEFTQENISQVVSNAQAAISLDDSSSVAYRLLGQAFQKQNRIEAAIDNYKKATRCYLDKEDKKNANYCLSQIEKLKKNNQIHHTKITYINNDVTQEFLKQAIIKYQKDDYHGALTDLNWFLDINPYYPEALCYRGLIFAKLGDSNKAIIDFAKAVKIEPQNVEWRYKRAIARLYLKDARGALQDFNDLIKKDPSNTDYLLYRGQAYTKLRQYDSAIENYDNAVIINPNSGKSYLNRGEVWEILKNWGKAILDYQTAASLFLSLGDDIQYQKARNKIVTLQSNIDRKQAEIEKLIRIPIKSFTSNRGSAIVEVVFNHQYTFDLIVDTGATITTITKKMQRVMGLETFGQQLCRVADGRIVEFDICFLKSLSVQEAAINNLKINVANKERGNEGLLGQDFLLNYEVRILQKEIHLYPH